MENELVDEDRNKEEYKVDDNSDEESFVSAEDVLEISKNEEITSKVESVEKNLEQALLAKEEGNDQYRQHQYDESIQAYTRGIVFTPDDDSCKELLSTLYGNRAPAYFSIGEYEIVIDDCSSALQLNTTYVKVLSRRSQAYEKLEKYDESLSGLLISFKLFRCLIDLNRLENDQRNRTKLS